MSSANDLTPDKVAIPTEESIGDMQSPPVQPPANPTDPNPDAVSEADAWVMDHFDALRDDEAQEDVSIVEPAAPIPTVSAPAERPEGVSSPPSQQTGERQEPLAAIATPVPGVSYPTPPAPVVGASGNQPASQGTATPPPPLDPTQLMSQLASAMDNQRAAIIEGLTKTYLMSEKDADDLGFTPQQAAYFARSKAEAHYEATASITRMQAEQLPGFVNSLQVARSENQKREDEFFGEFPELRSADKSQLGQILQMTSKIHPNLRGQEWRKKAGETALATLGIARQAPVTNGRAAPAPQRPAAPPLQQIRTPGPIVRQVNGLMHNPAGTSTAPPPPVAQKTEMEKFLELLQRTDAGEFEDH